MEWTGPDNTMRVPVSPEVLLSLRISDFKFRERSHPRNRKGRLMSSPSLSFQSTHSLFVINCFMSALIRLND